MNTVKKNQHYLPQFYLRNFSYQSNKKQIGIYNIISSFFHPTAPLKSQASEDFFYGRDGLIEVALSKAENQMASLIREIISSKKLPQKQTIKHRELLMYVVSTYLRNPLVIDNIKKSNEDMNKNLLEIEPKLDINTLSDCDAMKLSLLSLSRSIDNLEDLDYKLLINKTKKPFISADFPIVKYNRFLELKKWRFGKTGLGNIGLQIFVPLNPEITIIFYDPKIYKVGLKKRDVHELTKVSDIEKLNTLQILNCLESIFFNEQVSEIYIQNLVKKSSEFRAANKVESEVGILIEGDKSKMMVMTGITDCEINLEIEGISIHSNGKKGKLDNSIAQLRTIPKKLREASKFKHRN